MRKALNERLQAVAKARGNEYDANPTVVFEQSYVCDNREGKHAKGYLMRVYSNGRFERFYGSCEIDQSRWPFTISSYAGLGGKEIALKRAAKLATAKCKPSRKDGYYEETSEPFSAFATAAAPATAHAVAAAAAAAPSLDSTLVAAPSLADIEDMCDDDEGEGDEEGEGEEEGEGDEEGEEEGEDDGRVG